MGWFFSLDTAADMAVAYQLNPKPEYIAAIVGNMNYEGGSNPVNVAYLTGIGLKRQREVVSQYARNDRRALPPAGLPISSVTSSLPAHWFYAASGNEMEKLSFPTDNNAASNFYPFYDRWTDTWNVSAEFVVTNQARGLLSSAFLATQTASKSVAWKPS